MKWGYWKIQWCKIQFLIFQFEPPHDKTNKLTVRPAKTQISLGIPPVWSKSSLCTQWIPKDPSFLHADSEDSDQTGRMSRLIWVFAVRTCHFVGFVMRWLIFQFYDLSKKKTYCSINGLLHMFFRSFYCTAWRILSKLYLVYLLSIFPNKFCPSQSLKSKFCYRFLKTTLPPISQCWNLWRKEVCAP